MGKSEKQTDLEVNETVWAMCEEEVNGQRDLKATCCHDASAYVDEIVSIGTSNLKAVLAMEELETTSAAGERLLLRVHPALRHFRFEAGPALE
eukprot:142420-Amphidinium_carterae.1